MVWKGSFKQSFAIEQEEEGNYFAVVKRAYVLCVIDEVGEAGQ